VVLKATSGVPSSQNFLGASDNSDERAIGCQQLRSSGESFLTTSEVVSALVE
jgi:hypothetical protein